VTHTSKFRVKFASMNRKAQCEPNPNYPNGIDIDTGERPACKVDLPYPAECVGTWLVVCEECESAAAVTAAGRPDDPKSLALPCNKTLQ
jgi:hypothetical protein